MTAVKEQIVFYIRENLGIEDTEIVNELFKEYCTTFQNYLVKIAQYIEQTNADGLYRAAHSLKGCSGNVGHEQVHELCLLLESTAQEKNFAGAQVIHHRMQEAAGEMYGDC